MVRFIINNKFLRYSSFWWWYRLINHKGFRFDDYHIWTEFWYSINRGYVDAEQKYEFEKFWGKGAKVETMYVSADDYDALVEKLNEPPDPEAVKRLTEILRKPALWDEDT